MSDIDETIAEWRINGLELNEAEQFIERLIEDRKKLSTENEELKEGLTASYMLGSENGKEAAKAEISELKQERERLRVACDGNRLTEITVSINARIKQ